MSPLNAGTIFRGDLGGVHGPFDALALTSQSLSVTSRHYWYRLDQRRTLVARPGAA
jgi:hypothetical protein